MEVEFSKIGCCNFFEEKKEVRKIRSYFEFFKNLQPGEKPGVAAGDSLIVSGQELKKYKYFQIANIATFGLTETIGVAASRRQHGHSLEKTIDFFAKIEEKIESLGKKLEAIFESVGQKTLSLEENAREDLLYEIQLLDSILKNETTFIKDTELQTGFKNLLSTYKTHALSTQLTQKTRSLTEKATAFCQKFLPKI